MSLWRIQQNCPQCGGPAFLQDTWRIFRCEFCGVKLFIIPKDYLRYYIKPPDDSPPNNIYIPYWRLKGTVFTCSGMKVQKRLIERSYLAINADYLPFTLGYRVQTLNLYFLHQGNDGIFIKNDVLNYKTIFNIDDGDVFMPSNEVLYHRSFIGETISVIYSPFYIEGDKLYDSVLKRKITSVDKNSEKSPIAMQRCDGWQVRFLPTICRKCGWDLQCEGDSIVLPCTNCSTLWDISHGEMSEVDCQVMISSEKTSIYLPFWRLEANFSGIQIDSYMDIAKIANLPRVFKKEWENSVPYFWCPAFKVTPDVFLRLTRQLTLYESISNIQHCNELSTAFEPANLPLSSALESIKITIANISSDRKNFFPLLKQVVVHLKKSQMVYLPFISSGNELIQETLRFSIHKNTLKTGRML